MYLCQAVAGMWNSSNSLRIRGGEKGKKTHVAPVFLIGASCLSFEARCVSGKLKLDATLDGVAPSLLSIVTAVAA